VGFAVIGCLNSSLHYIRDTFIPLLFNDQKAERGIFAALAA